MSDSEYRLLSAIESNGGAVLSCEITDDDARLSRLLCQREYLTHFGALNAAHYEITPAGHLALEDHRAILKRRRRDNVRYIITTAVAVLALIVSIIALFS